MKLLEKIFKVIASCETDKQREVAKRYLDLACENGYIEKELHKAIHINTSILFKN